MEILNDQIASYIVSRTSPESEVLKKLDRETNANVLMPRMISGHVQGRVLSMLSNMIRPACILEIGTFTGYSALCLAEGLIEGGKLITIDINEELEGIVKKYIAASGVENKIQCLTGNALEILPSLNMEFDLIFIDADKCNYINYYNLVFDKVKSGGYILADNVLWNGKVIAEDAKDKDLMHIMEFNKLVQQDSRVENTILPVRDGIMIARKL